MHYKRSYFSTKLELYSKTLHELEKKGNEFFDKLVKKSLLPIKKERISDDIRFGIR